MFVRLFLLYCRHRKSLSFALWKSSPCPSSALFLLIFFLNQKYANACKVSHPCESSANPCSEVLFDNPPVPSTQTHTHLLSLSSCQIVWAALTPTHEKNPWAAMEQLVADKEFLVSSQCTRRVRLQRSPRHLPYIHCSPKSPKKDTPLRLSVLIRAFMCVRVWGGSLCSPGFSQRERPPSLVGLLQDLFWHNKLP